MHSKDRLAAELLKAGLPALAKRAADGMYHDYLSPVQFPSLLLMTDLISMGTPAARALVDRHSVGEFDAPAHEAEPPPKSPPKLAAVRDVSTPGFETAAKVSAALRDIAPLIHADLCTASNGAPVHFALFVQSEGYWSYVSDLERPGVVASLKEMLTRWEAEEPDTPAHEVDRP